MFKRLSGVIAMITMSAGMANAQSGGPIYGYFLDYGEVRGLAPRFDFTDTTTGAADAKWQLDAGLLTLIAATGVNGDFLIFDIANNRFASNGDIINRVDNNNDGTENYTVQNGAGTTIFDVAEDGTTTLGPSTATAIVDADGDVEVTKHMGCTGPVATVDCTGGTQGSGTAEAVNAASCSQAGLFGWGFPTPWTTGPTQCVVTFGDTWESAPVCIANPTVATLVGRVSTTHTTTFTYEISTSVTVAFVTWICMGRV